MEIFEEEDEEIKELMRRISRKEITLCDSCDTFFDYIPLKTTCDECKIKKRREYCQRPEVKERRREYLREYYQRPEKRELKRERERKHSRKRYQRLKQLREEE